MSHIMKKAQKRKDVSKHAYERLLQIDKLIRSGKYPNCSTFMKLQGICRRTAERDLDYLRDRLGAPIEYNSMKRGFYYSEDYAFPELKYLNEGDLFSLCIAEKSLEQYRNTPMYDSLQQIFRKLSAALPGEVSIKKEWVGSHYSLLNDSPAVIDPEIWSILTQAVA